MNTVKWLLVGAGDIARKRVSPALTSANHSALVAVCDLREAEARAVAAEAGAAEVYSDFEKALNETSADAVYLATPVWLHARHAEAALQAGKHVLVEKPLALTVADAESVVTAAEHTKAKAGCSYFRRFFPRYLHARKMLQKGEFGEITLVRICYFSWFDPAEGDLKYWRVERAKSGGGVLSDMGSHMFDVLIGLFGLPRSVYAKCANLVHKWDVEDSASILMTLESGAHVAATFHWNSKTWRHEFEIVGTEAKVCWLPCDTGPVTKTVGRDNQELAMPNAENVHLPLVEDFVEAVRNDREPASSVIKAVKTNLLLDAVYRSAASGREIALQQEK